MSRSVVSSVWFVALTFWSTACHPNVEVTSVEPRVTATSAPAEPDPLTPVIPTTARGTSPCPSPMDKGVHLVGRYDGCNRNGPRMSWSGSGFVARFHGTGLHVTVDGPSLIFTTVIDGVVGKELVTNSGPETYVLVDGLTPGEHTVEMYRQGEAELGAFVLQGVHAAGGELLSSPAPKRRIELVGDSITAGYGNEGSTPECSFSAQTENHYFTYGALLAREFDAEASTVAWSGKGVVSNYGGKRDTTFPALYPRAVPSDPASLWDFSSWQPDVVLVNLGTNDYSTDNDPTDVEFTTEYERLLSTIRLRYPTAHIICTIGPLLVGTDLATAEANIRAAVARRVAAGDAAVAFFAMRVPNAAPGCDWHPGLGTHRAMAEALRPVIAAKLGW